MFHGSKAVQYIISVKFKPELNIHGVTLMGLSESVWTSDCFTTSLTQSLSHFRHLVTPNKVLSIMKVYLEPTFVLIFNLEAAVKISLLGWTTYREFSKLTTSGHSVDTFDRSSMSHLLICIPEKLIDNR